MLIRIIKILVSVSLIGVLLWGVDWRDITDRMQGIDPLLAIAAFVLLSVQYPVSAWKWQKSLRLHGVEQPYGRLLRILCIAFFFNNFLPTAIGGDAYRAYKTFEHSSRPARAISAVILERLLGILALLFLGYVCAIYLLVTRSIVHHDWVQAGIVAVTIGAVLTLIAWRLDSAFVRNINRKLAHIPKLEPFFDSVRTIKKHRQHLPGLVGLSLLFQTIAIITVSVMFASIGITGQLPESGFTAAAAGIAGVLPISINGVGVIEGSFVVAAIEAGLPYSGSVLIAIGLRGYMILSSIAFGVWYALEPKEQTRVKEDRVSQVNHLPNKFQYVLKTLIRRPFELIRLVRVAWTTFKYRYIYRCAKASTVIGESTVMINTLNIRIGSACLIQDRVYLRAGVDGSIEIGDGAALNSFVQIYGHGNVKIGASTQIGPGTIITTSGHDYRATDLAQDNAPIVLGDRVWIGANCTILPGVTIGDKAVIGAGAVVADDIPANCVAVGVPARVIRYFESEQPEDDACDTAARA